MKARAMATDQTTPLDEEDAGWKADHIASLISKHGLALKSIGDLACGSGAVLRALAQHGSLKDTRFAGFDLDPQAIAQANGHKSASSEGRSLSFHQGNPSDRTGGERFDAILMLDYFEHVSDYLGLLEQCKALGRHKIFHIPLEICVLSVLRDACVRNRYSLGHIHYFTAESALASLKDSGHEIIDYRYTDSAGHYQQLHPSLKKKIASLPRTWLAKVNLPLAAKVLGGYSLLVLTQ
jgi:SAM-dependent methyltransferase